MAQPSDVTPPSPWWGSPAEFGRPWKARNCHESRPQIWAEDHKICSPTDGSFVYDIFWMYTHIRWVCTIIICEHIHFYVFYMFLPYYMIFAENQIEPRWFWSICKLSQVVPNVSEVEKKNCISKVEMSCQGCASPRANDNLPCTLKGALGHPARPLRECHHKLWECCRHCEEELESPAQVITPWSGKKRSVQL